MPNIQHDLRLTIERYMPADSTTNSYELNHTPQFEYTPPPRVDQDTPKSAQKKTPPKQLITPDDIINVCDKNLLLADQALKDLDKRCKFLIKVVDRVQEPLLWQSCKRIYGQNFSGRITFDMYRQALDYNIKLCKQMRVPSNG